jgi:hypothetical protein
MCFFIQSFDISWYSQFSALQIIQFLGVIFLAVLFLQSGLDKVIDWSGNLSWLNSHFSKSIFKNIVKPLLLIISILEIFAGVFCFVGSFMIIINQTIYLAVLGVVLSSLSLISLFIGQRIAKDYAGAGSLVNYFILCLLMLYFLTL